MVDLEDKFERRFKKLRVSLLTTCNLGCIYCTMGSEDEIAYDHRPQTSASEFLQTISTLHQQLQFKTIRFTGGEPLLYRELVKVIAGVKALGIPDISLTTNGFLLDRFAPLLKQAGLRSVNVSLDAVDEGVFFRMTRRKQLSRTLQGIESAINCGLHVKINAVVMKGENDDQILPLLDYAFGKSLPIRFLEVMSMGHLFGKSDHCMFRQSDILNVIANNYNFKRMPRTASSTANYWQTAEGKVFGVIGNESEPFCQDCDRLRLDAEGNIFGCLSDNNPISLRGIQDESELNEKLQHAMYQKQESRFIGSAMSMMKIGG